MRSELTYANVVASLALFVALAGGTAIAASQFERESIGTRALKKEAVTPLKLSKKSKAALTGAAGPQGPQGPAGAAGAAGSSLAYARIEATGVVELAFSKNVGSLSVTRPSKGEYCLSGLPFTPKNVVATPQFDDVAINAFIPGFENCPAGTQVSVDMNETGKGTPRESPFMILFN